MGARGCCRVSSGVGTVRRLSGPNASCGCLRASLCVCAFRVCCVYACCRVCGSCVFGCVCRHRYVGLVGCVDSLACGDVCGCVTFPCRVACCAFNTGCRGAAGRPPTGVWGARPRPAGVHPGPAASPLFIFTSSRPGGRCQNPTMGLARCVARWWPLGRGVAGAVGGGGCRPGRPGRPTLRPARRSRASI